MTRSNWVAQYFFLGALIGLAVIGCIDYGLRAYARQRWEQEYRALYEEALESGAAVRHLNDITGGWR